MQVRMNSWKKLLFRVRAGAEAGLRPGSTGPRAGCLMAGLPRGNIVVEMRRSVMTKREKLFCLLNGLAKLLGTSF